MKIVISGLGIIGGSFAKALKKYTDNSIIGINRSRQPLEAALQCGAFDEIGDASSLEDADMLILGTFPRAAVDFVRANAERIPSKCLVIDSCGIKSEICPELKALSEEYGFVFVGCHPMAGKETNGFVSAEADLFVGASCILVPCGADDKAVEKVAGLMKKLQFGQVICTDPEHHDRMIAFTSQIPHVLACAYVMSPACPEHNGYSAGSYRDVSRVARINEKLWAELFIENREALMKELDTLMENINNIRTALSKCDRQELEQLLAKSRQVKEALGE